MRCGLTSEFGTKRGAKGLGAGDTAFRCGLPTGGNGRPIRDAVPVFIDRVPYWMGAPLEITWAPDVIWKKRVRASRA